MSLISYQHALSQVLTRVPKAQVRTVPLHESLGRILATPVRADEPLPSFKKSFMDGYALRSRDVRTVPTILDVIGQIAAGPKGKLQISRDEAVQIMTGAPVPATADAVQMVEKTRRVEGGVEILEPVVPGQHIAPAGSEVEKGQLVLEEGSRIGPREIAILACFGLAEVQIYELPGVAIISTGDELVDIDKTPAFGQIRNSNAHMLWAQCQELGLQADIEPRVRDDPEKVRAALRLALRRDLVLFSGGVSMGEYDYVHKVLAEEGLEILFHKVAIRPGKPVMVGALEEKMVFGLPGNPVSAFVTFMLFVKPAVQQWSGSRLNSFLEVSALLEEEVKFTPGRLFFMPGQARLKGSEVRVRPFSTKGSADMVGFSQANALICIPADQGNLPAGSVVEVILLDGGHAAPSN